MWTYHADVCVCGCELDFTKELEFCCGGNERLMDVLGERIHSS